MQQDRHVAERATPFDHARVVVRMRDRNRADAAGFAHACHGVVIDQRDAVPQQVAARRTHQQRALADREAWLGADAEQAFGLRFDAVAMRVAQRFERGPLLPAAADVLALVLADRATRSEEHTSELQSLMRTSY